MNTEEQSILKLIEHWGYYLLPKSRPQSPGYTGLLVAIRERPTGMHFDPEKVRIRLRDPVEDRCDWRLVSRLSPVREAVRVCPGLVSLADRVGKRVDFFSYGGWLESTQGPGELVYSLRSRAPVLRITENEETVANQLAAESEALLAEIEAGWLPRDEPFRHRLAHLDPLQAYLGTLCSLMNSYEQQPGRRTAFRELHDALEAEVEWLVYHGVWPDSPCGLEELLGRKAPSGAD